MEAGEIKEFTEQMEEGSKAGGMGVSLAISVLAVMVAMITVLGHRAHTQAVLAQSRASDQWNLYQAKKIRQENVALTADLIRVFSMPPSKEAAAKLNEYTTHSAKWDTDLAQESDAARGLEDEADHAERRADRYDLSEALLQIGVVLASITLLTRRKSYAVAGVTLGVAGLLVAASVFLIR
jgi:hypothetical protein